MCLTIPAKIISVDKNKAKVKIGKKEQSVNCQLVKVKKGDWAILTNNYITAKISAKEAKATLKLIGKEVR